jgi:hypothetical protein
MKIIVCADDYALSPGVSAGIRRTLAAGRVSATSVMPLPPFWPAEAGALVPYLDLADIGLHLTLTDQSPLGSMPHFAQRGILPAPSCLLEMAANGTLPLEEIAQEITRQFEAFEQALGRPPDHVDGHHYVHHLPGIRECLVEVMRRKAPEAYMRNCFTPPEIIHRRGIGAAKALALNARGQGFGACLQHLGIPHNKDLTGLYDFDGQEGYDALFTCFLSGIEEGSLLVCHPGHVDAALAQRDSLYWRREEELAWFLGEAYPSLLARQGIQISRFRDIST